MEARGPCLSSAATQVSWVAAGPGPACPVPLPRSAPGHQGVGYHLPPPQEAFGPAWAVRRGSGAEPQPGMLCWAVSQARGWGSCWSPQGLSLTGRVTLTSLTCVRGTSPLQPH